MRVLIVDDEKTIRVTLTIALEGMGHTAQAAANGALALNALRKNSFDAVLLDLRLSEESGLELLDEIVKISPRIAVVMVTAFGSIETAVGAIQRGAFDYLAKPCTPDQLRHVLGRVEATRKLENRVAELESGLALRLPDYSESSESPTMKRSLDLAFKAAGSDATILLLGESGTGKSVLARAIHQESDRAHAAFITVSCPSLSRELLESDLFGHAKGAFTGAVTEKWGKVTAAEGGTLFLDEIGDLPLDIQAKLLRLLQEREYERIGETNSHRSNVRVIAATNRNLLEAIAAGKFREDLYYRLNVISISLPPLRERMTDLEAHANRYLRELARQTGTETKQISRAAWAQMRAYHWPGNLRELRNVLERAAILCAGQQIQMVDLAETISGQASIHIGGKVSLADLEALHIKRVMENSRTLEEAAHVLGIDSATLYRKRKRSRAAGQEAPPPGTDHPG